MIQLAVSFLLGVLIFQTSHELPSFYIILPVVLSGLIWLKYPRTRIVFICMLGYGWAYFFAYQQLSPRLAPEQEGVDIQIEGVIEALTVNTPQYRKFTLQVAPATLEKMQGTVPRKLQLSWYRYAQSLRAAQHCTLTVRLKRPWSYANPGGVDYDKTLYLKGIGARGYVRAGQCEVTADTPELGVSLREQWIENFLLLSHDYQYAELMQALTFGYRENIEAAQWEVLRQTGTAHLLAISGLHLSAVALIVFVSVRRLSRFSVTLCNIWSAQSIAAVVAMLATLFYAYLAGFSLPTQRAFIMVSVGLFAILYRRPVFNLQVLATALLMVLIVNPLSVLSAGFWLSFLAILFIFIALKACETKSKLTKIIVVQIFLSIALFPVTLLFFSQASIISPVVNLLAIPFVSFIVLPLLLLAQLGFLLGIGGVENLFTLIDKIFDWLWQGLELSASIPFSAWDFAPTLTGVICFELGLLMLVQAKGLPYRHLGWILIAALFLLKDSTLQPGQLRMTVLDVGQGLAVVVETQQHTLLYDAGMRTPSGFNTGQVVVKPYLDWRDIRTVDLAIASHNDNDHAGGLYWLLDNIAIERLMVSNQADRYPSHQAELCRAQDEWRWDGVHFQVLHPTKQWQSNDNNRSCVVKITHPAGSILLTGDIEARAEARLIEQYGDNLHSDIITAPHHGSSSSSSYRFVDLVYPQTVVFSAGYRNRYGFPHATIRQRYEAAGARIMDTSRQGAVTFLFDPQSGIQQQPGYRDSNKRYWHASQVELTNRIE